MKLSILVPVYNNLSYTKNCLHNLNEFCVKNSAFHKEVTTSIIVIDDGSTDGTKEWIQEYSPTVHLIQGNGNLWWSGAINKGIEYDLKELQSDYILFWNNDIEVKSDYFPNLLSVLKENDSNTIIGSKIYCKDTSTVWSMGGLVNLNKGNTSMIGSMMEDSDDLNKIQNVDWLTGMGSVYPASVFNTIGLINDKDFPQYFGDLDISYRAKLSGYSVKVFPKLQIWNDIVNTGIKHNGSFKQLRSSFTSIKSLYNLSVDIKFQRKYIKSYKGYFQLFIKYSKYIGGYIKNKLLPSTN